MKKLIKIIVEKIYSRIKPNDKTVLILESSFPSGSNTKILTRNKSYLEEQGFKVVEMNYHEVRVTQGGLKAYLKYVKKMRYVSTFEYVIATHSFQKLNKQQKYINFWHGIPLKAMKKMELDAKEVNRPIGNEDVLVTNSKLESTLMSASLHIPFIKHKIIGSPRLDYLKTKTESLNGLSFIKEYNHVLFYLPTFRLGYFDRVEGKSTGNLFNLDAFDTAQFKSFLKEHNILCITKYHPREQELIKTNYDLKDNIMNLTDNMLVENDLDLYQILNHTDLLISDYSSVFLDYLILDKPIIYAISDLKEYREDRGFVLEPYEKWVAGPSIDNQASLQEEIITSLKDLKYYQEERQALKDYFHPLDNNSNTHKFFDMLINKEI